MMVLVRAGGFTACLQAAGLSREELSEKWIRKGIRSWTANPSSSIATCPEPTWSHWCLHQHKPSQELLLHVRAAALTALYCLWERPSRAIPSVQPCPLLRLQETFFFWLCEPVQTEINTPLKRAGPSWYFILMAKKKA